MSGYDFANILFAGPCNRFCPFCIGQDIDARLSPNNLDTFPPLNWDEFTDEVRRNCIREIVFTGTTTDPHLYRHEEKLLNLVRRDLPETQISIHTNGALSLKNIRAFNLYDRAVISFPSFDVDTYGKMMGTRSVPNLEKILASSKIPVKISCVVNEQNIRELDGFVLRLKSLGVKRLVLRQLFGETRQWNVFPQLVPERFYRNNPVYDFDGIEVTYWNFYGTESKSINLFADGTIGHSYLLSQTSAARVRARN